MKPRDAYLDNAKALLVTLVVVGHLIARTSVAADPLYKWIYAFHMPAFITLSGFLSRSYRGAPRQSLALVTSLLTPYVLVSLVLATEHRLQGHPFSLRLFTPDFALWYLLALMAWRIATPLLRAVPFALPIAALTSILSVTYGGVGHDLSAARILSFLPFFMLGLSISPENLATFRRRTAPWAVRGTAAVGLGIAFLAAWHWRADIKRDWLAMDGHDASLGNLDNALVRLGTLAVASAMLLAFMALVPRQRCLLTVPGQHSMYIYLLHAMIVYPLLSVIADHAWTRPQAWALVPAAIVLALALGTPLAKRLSSWFIDPFGTFPALRVIAERRLPAAERSVV